MTEKCHWKSGNSNRTDRWEPCNGDITDKSAEYLSGHLVALDHEFGCTFARSVHLKYWTEHPINTVVQ